MAGPLNLSEHDPEPAHSPSVPTPQFELPREEPVFTAYLDTVCTRVQPLAPEAWVTDLRAELACHLECTAEAYAELGETPEQAVASACRSLGEPARLARRWERYWQEKAREPLRITTLRAVGYFSLATLLHAGMVFSFGKFLFSPECLLDPAIPHALLLPVCVGILIARRARGRRALETAGVTAVAALLVAALTALLCWILPGPNPEGIRELIWGTTLTFWLPLGMATAGITRLACSAPWRKRLQRGA